MAEAFDELAGLYFKAGSKAGGVYKKVCDAVRCPCSETVERNAPVLFLLTASIMRSLDLVRNGELAHILLAGPSIRLKCHGALGAW